MFTAFVNNYFSKVIVAIKVVIGLKKKKCKYIPLFYTYDLYTYTVDHGCQRFFLIQQQNGQGEKCFTHVLYKLQLIKYIGFNNFNDLYLKCSLFRRVCL